MKTSVHNKFSMAYYEQIINNAKNVGYQFVTLSQFIELGCPDELYFVIRHDLDHKPMTLKNVIETESKLNVKSTTFVRIAGAEYNVLSYPVFNMLKMAEESGMEIGLHTNFIEFANINNVDPSNVLSGELSLLRSFFNVKGIAPHRDINYTFNSLPWLNMNWEKISNDLKLDYHSYEERIFSKVLYVNEGLDPHLCWRNPPEKAIVTGKSICMLTHSHWWFKDHPFEVI